MIKKVFAISLILFFALAGNAFAIAHLGDVHRSDIIGNYLDCSSGMYGYSVVFYSSQDPAGIGVLHTICDYTNPLQGNGLKTFGDFWGSEQYNQNIYLLYVDTSHAEPCVSTSDYSICSAWATRFAYVKLLPDPPPPPILSMPETASSDILVANVGGLFTDFWPIITIMFGIPLAFYIIPRVIELVVVRNKS